MTEFIAYSEEIDTDEIIADDIVAYDRGEIVDYPPAWAPGWDSNYEPTQLAPVVVPDETAVVKGQGLLPVLGVVLMLLVMLMLIVALLPA